MKELPKIGLLPWLALLVVLITLFARLGELPFRDPDEGRNAEVAREMKQTGAWLVPTYDGLAYLDKPAFFFKAVALSYALFGESEIAARLPSALFATLLLAMLFAFCMREYQDRNTAALAVIITATSPLFLALARHVIFDMTLAFFVSAAIFCGYLAETVTGWPRSRWYLLGSAAAGFATLVKGPVGFLIPLLVVTIFNLVEGRRGWGWRAFSPWNVLIFFAVVLPWFVSLSYQRPDFPYYGLVEESFHRFTTTSFQRGGPFYYYGFVLLGGLFAWSILLPEAAAKAWANRSKLVSADRLFIVWSIVVVLFFSISKSKLPAYILTVSAALGVLLARLFAAALKNPNGEATRLVFRGLLFLALLSVAFATFLALDTLLPGSYEKMGLLRSSEFGRLTVLFAPSACVFLIVALMAAVAFWRRDIRIAFATFLLLPLLTLTIDFGALLHYSEASSSRQIARSIPSLPPETAVVCLECFPCGLPYYLKQSVVVVSKDGSELTSNYVTFTLKKTKVWPEVVVPLDDWGRWLAARDKAIYLVADRRSHDALTALASERKTDVRELAPGWWGALIAPGAI
jgi:4-amino-4-deoxy-L-arabinose transferase-like glycosyltransferase